MSLLVRGRIGRDVARVQVHVDAGVRHAGAAGSGLGIGFETENNKAALNAESALACGAPIADTAGALGVTAQGERQAPRVPEQLTPAARLEIRAC